MSEFVAASGGGSSKFPKPLKKLKTGKVSKVKNSKKKSASTIEKRK